MFANDPPDMKKLLLILCLLARLGVAQTPEIDSLKQKISELRTLPVGLGRDTTIYHSLKQLMTDYVEVNLDSALHYTAQMIALSQQPKLQKELIYAYQFEGYIYQIKGDHYQSIQAHYKALLLAEKLKNHTRAAISLGGLAHAYMSLKEYSKAIELCKKGRNLIKDHPNPKAQMPILNVLGGVYKEQGRLREALTTYQELNAVSRSAGNLWYETQSLHAIGWVYDGMGNVPKALVFYQKSLALSEKTGSVDLKGSILLNIAGLYITQKKWKEALAYCNLAKTFAISVNNSSVVVEADEKLYRIFKQTGETSKALKAHENYTVLRDSLSKEKNDQRIEALQAQYDNVQKQNALQKQQVQLLAQENQNQELAQTRNILFFGIAGIFFLAGFLFWNNRRLQSKNRQINQQKVLLEQAQEQLSDVNKTLEIRVEARTQELVQANRELIQKNEEIKGALFKGQTIERKRVAIELHDNLSSLLSAVNMSIQHINPQNLSDQEQSVYRNVKQMVKSAYSEVRNISHNILPAELEKEGLSSVLTTLIAKLNQNSPLQFRLTNSLFKNRLPAEIEFNVYSILLELINNVIKHAQALNVDIELKQTSQGIELSVADDGIGLPAESGKQGVGLQNIRSRLDALGGTFEARQRVPQGTEMAINIPIESSYSDGDVQGFELSA